MDLTCDERPSDSPFIKRIWRGRAEHAGRFTSVAATRSELVVAKFQGKLSITIRGPETRPTPAYGPADAELFGVEFSAGTFMPQFPAQMVMDRCDVLLPSANANTFWLGGAAWQYPTFDNVEVFIQRLLHDELLVHDPLVLNVLQHRPIDLSPRTIQRRFLFATGLTYGTMFQIQRARHATRLLTNGRSIHDTVECAGYADQSHLTRAMKRFIGHTPAQLMDTASRQPLSFLFKTDDILMP
jgi:AraC-like DNA-binding protein